MGLFFNAKIPKIYEQNGEVDYSVFPFLFDLKGG